MKILKKIKLYFLKRNRHIHISNDVDINFKNVYLDEYVNMAYRASIANSKVGRCTSIGRYTKIQMAEIGKYCSISWDCTIGALEHNISSVSTHAFSYRKQFGLVKCDSQIPHRKCIIGNDVWIGCGSIIMPGVRIGSGAIIGAGSVVTKDVDSYEIVAGVPAKHIRYRFNHDIKAKLLEISWWNFHPQIIKDNIELFMSEVDLSCDKYVIEKLMELKEVQSK